MSASVLIMGRVPDTSSKQIFACCQNDLRSVFTGMKPQSPLLDAFGNAEHSSKRKGVSKQLAATSKDGVLSHEATSPGASGWSTHPSNALVQAVTSSWMQHSTGSSNSMSCPSHSALMVVLNFLLLYLQQCWPEPKANGWVLGQEEGSEKLCIRVRTENEFFWVHLMPSDKDVAKNGFQKKALFDKKWESYSHEYMSLILEWASNTFLARNKWRKVFRKLTR